MTTPIDYATGDAARPTASRDRVLRVVNVCCGSGAAFLLLMGTYPGGVSQLGCMIVLLFPLIAGLGLTWLLVLARSLPRPLGTGRPMPRIGAILTAPVLVILTVALLAKAVPLRVGFYPAVGAFNAMLPKAPPPSTFDPVRLNRRVGIYRVDEWVTDPRGGVYFRTGTTADMIDTISFGFAYKPNKTGTPFGAASYRYGRLTGGWYWWSASNDSY